MLKQVILVRNDLKMPKGKLAVQCSHASVESVLKTNKSRIDSWRQSGMKKSILKVSNKEELLFYNKEAKKSGLTTALITDAGKTFFNKATLTCLVIGPDDENKIDKITKNLKLI